MAILLATAKDLVDRYFKSWENHDCDALEDIFEEDASYVINGDVRYTSRLGIRNYWTTNKRRQSGVVTDHLVDETSKTVTRLFVAFSAQFEDVQEGNHVDLSGIGVFEFGPNGRIQSFDEKYIVRNAPRVRRRLALLSHSAWVASRKTAAKGWAAFLRKIAWMKPFLIGLAFVIACALFALAAYVTFLENTVYDLIPEDKEGLVTKGMSFSFLVWSALFFFRDLMKKGKYTFVTRKRIYPGDLTDLKIMYAEMKSAHRVYIYSGDFSFLSEHNPLAERLLDLAQRQKLILVSYKSEAEIRNAATSSIHSQILSALSGTGSLKADQTEEAKYSVIEKNGSKLVLFRYEDSDQKDYVGIIRANSNVGSALLNSIEAVTRSVAS